MKAFDYQIDFKNGILKKFREGKKRVIAQASTGFGKTVTFADITLSAISKGSVTCIVCHREEIFKQIFKTLVKVGVTPSLIAPGIHPKPGAQVYLGMVETICRRMNKGLIDKLNINFFILDEVHYGSYYKLVKDLDCHVLGFTATPKSTGSPDLNEYFEDIVCGIPLSELIRIKRLVPARTISVKHDFSKVKMKGKEFDDRAMFQEFKKPKLWEGAVKAYLQFYRGAPALFYNVNVEHSLEVTRQLRDAGIKAAHVDGTTPKSDRDAIFSMYRSSQIEVVNNVGIATAGYDAPWTRVVAMNFATASLPKAWQVKGRGARCEDYDHGWDLGDKDEFGILDWGRNYIRHGKFFDKDGRGDDVDWVDIFQNPGKACVKDGKKKTNRECDACGSVIQFRLKMCPYCGDIISTKELEDKLFLDSTPEEIKEYRKSNLPVHLRKNPMDMNKGELIKLCKHMGYKMSYVHVILNQQQRRRN